MAAKQKFAGPKLKYPTVKAVLPVGVAGWSHLDEPDAFQPGDTPKFKTTVTFSKDHPDIANIIAGAVAEVSAKTWPKAKLTSIRSPLKDGDALNEKRAEDDKEPIAGYEGRYVVNASTKQRPRVVDSLRADIDAKTVWSGDEIKINVQFIPSETNGQKQVSLRLLAVQLIRKNAGDNSGAVDDFEDEDGYVASKAGGGDSGASGASGDDEDDF